jgi:hypothetical protein
MVFHRILDFTRGWISILASIFLKPILIKLRKCMGPPKKISNQKVSLIFATRPISLDVFNLENQLIYFPSLLVRSLSLLYDLFAIFATKPLT